MSKYTTGTVTVYFVAENPNKVVNNLQNTSEPIYKYATLTWTEPSEPGRYHVYWEVDGNWINSGQSTTSNSITVQPPRNATRFQLRTDNLYPSNIITAYFHEVPETRTLSYISRYDGILLDWQPNTLENERVEVVKDGTTVFTGNATSYIHPSGGVFKVRMVKGVGSDVVYGAFSNSVTAALLDPPPPRPEPESPCDFFLGVNRAGEEILHICNPAVVPAAPPAVESGKTATDWFQDWVGVNVDYGDDTYMHSMFDYVKCTKYVRLIEYTNELLGLRTFLTSSAVDGITGTPVDFTFNPSAMVMVVAQLNNGDREASFPFLQRELEISDTHPGIAKYRIGNFGSGTSGAYFNVGTNKIRTHQGVLAVEIYEFNFSVSNRTLVYEGVDGVDDGIILNPNEFRVGAADFSGMFLCYTGRVNNNEYVNSMNLSDPIMAFGGNVNTAGIYSGVDGADSVQILGGSGGSGWDIEMTKGIIKRGGKTWFNAGRGRTRLRYVGKSDAHTTESFQWDVPEHEVQGNQGTEVGFVQESGIRSSQIIILDNPVVRNASVLGFCLTPIDWQDEGDSTTWDELYGTDRAIVGFTSFGTRVPIYRSIKSATAGKSVLPSGDPYYELRYDVFMTLYMTRLDESTIVLEYDYEYRSFYGSAGLPRTFSVPGFSFSFIGLN